MWFSAASAESLLFGSRTIKFSRRSIHSFPAKLNLLLIGSTSPSEKGMKLGSSLHPGQTVSYLYYSNTSATPVTENI
jgi:hypothetical protein